MGFRQQHRTALRGCAVAGAVVGAIGVTELLIYGVIWIAETTYRATLLTQPWGRVWLANGPQTDPYATTKNVLLISGITAAVTGAVTGIGCGVAAYR